MFLKRLELQGFKSFADKTSLDFGSHIVAVVGPNGSGKSNVTDAIRWLLGERDARNLRGGKVEDLIFAGTESRPRLGLAQAALYFDNSSRFFPVDFNEVSISRRVTRDGVSEFFLNKSEVRLKDVVDFFAKSKLGARGLSIITQGESDAFIKASPKDRREMIEEILGLKEYQIKKFDSIRKLKNTYINLEKVKSLLQELKPHLRFLKKQVSRYADRDVIAKELENLENNFYGYRLKIFNKELAENKHKKQELSVELEKEVKLSKSLDEELKNIQMSQPKAGTEFEHLESKKQGLLNKRSNIQKEIGRAEAQMEFKSAEAGVKSVDLHKTLIEIKNLAASLLNEERLDILRSQLGAIIKKIESVFSAPVKKEDEGLKYIYKKLIEELRVIDEEVKKLVSEESKLKSGLDNFNKDFRVAYEKLEEQKVKTRSLEDEMNKSAFNIEKSELMISNLVEELRQIGRSLESLGNISGSGVHNPDINDSAAIQRMFKLRGELSAIGDIDQGVVKEATETEERFNFLTGQVDDLEKAIADLKSLIVELDGKIHHDFTFAIKEINEELSKFMRLMFGGGRAKLIILRQEEPKVAEGEEAVVQAEEGNEYSDESLGGIDIDLILPKKKIKGLEVLSGGEKSLMSVAVLFSLISVSPPPFLVLDEIDAALDERNARRFSDILKDFAKKTQFILITHNRATMEAADVLYGVTMGPDGTSKIVSLKIEDESKLPVNA